MKTLSRFFIALAIPALLDSCTYARGINYTYASLGGNFKGEINGDMMNGDVNNSDSFGAANNTLNTYVTGQAVVDGLGQIPAITESTGTAVTKIIAD